MQGLHFQIDGELRSEPYDAVVEKGEATFYSMRHGDAVSLRGENVAGKQILCFEILGAAEGMPGEIAGRQGVFESVVPVAGRQSGQKVGREEHLEFGGQLPAGEMREKGFCALRILDMEEGLAIGVRLMLQVFEIGIKPAQQQGAKSRVRMGGPESANLIFLKNVVSAEYLVGSFAGYDHFIALLMHQAREKVQRRGCGAQQRFFRVPDYFRKHLRNLFSRAAKLMVFGIEETHGFPLVGAFVKFRLGEAEGECG